MSVALEDLVARLRLDTSGMQASMAAASSSVSAAGDKMRATGTRLTAGLTLPLAGVATASTLMAADFDKTMRQVAIATGGPSKALEALAVQMGAETAFSAKDAADAMLELAKGGMTAATIQGGALQETMRLASAGGVDLASASTYVSNTMATFGLKAKDASDVTVALAGAANASSASVESLGQGLSQGALAARNAGLSLQETTGVLSLFDAQGLKGADAGTSLKSMLNALTPSSKKASDAMKDLGLKFTNANGTFKPIAGVADELKNKLSGLTEVQRAQALETIFGSDGVRAATLLMNGGSAAVEKYTKASKDQKTTTELANAAMEGTSGAIERAKGSLETAALTIGQTIAPAVERLAGYVERGANAFSNLSGPVKVTVAVVGAIAAAAGPLLIVLGSVASAVGTLTGLFAASAPAATAAGAAAGASVAPFLLVAGAVAALVAGFVLLYQRSESFRAIVQSGLASVVSAFQSLMAAVQPIIQQIVGLFVSEWPKIQQTIAQVFASVQSIVRSAFSIVSSIVKIATALILTVWATFGDTILSTLRRIMTAVQQVVRGAFQIVQGIFKTFASLLKGDWSGMWDGIVTIAKGIGNVLGGVVRGAWAIVRGVFSAAFDVLQSLAASFWTAVTETFGEGVTKAVNKAKEIKAKLTGAFSAAGEWLKSAGEAIVQGLGNGIEAAKQWVIDKIQALADLVPGWVKKRLGIASPSKVMHALGEHTGQGLANGIAAKQAAVTDAAKKATEAAEKAADARKDRLERVGKILSDGFAEGIVGGKAHIVAEMNGVMDALEKVHNARATKIAENAERTLRPLGQQYGNLRKDLAAAEAALSQFEAARKIVEQRQGALSSAGGDLTGLNLGTDADGNPIGPTAQNVIAALEAVNAAATNFDSNLVALRDAGLSQDALDQLIAKGPEAAAAMAQAILAGGPEAIARINALQANIASVGLSIQSKASQTMYDAGVAAQQGLISGLESQMNVLEEKMTGIAKAMVRAIRKALKINSPSRVMAGLGAYTGQGFADGMISTTRLVSKAADGLAAAALVQPPTLTPAAARGGFSQGSGGTAAAVPPPEVRVFIGERELTDIVRVELMDTIAPLSTYAKTGVI